MVCNSPFNKVGPIRGDTSDTLHKIKKLARTLPNKLLQFTKRQPSPNFGLMRLNNPRPVDPATGPDWQGKTDVLIRALRGGGLDQLLQEGIFRAIHFSVHELGFA